MPKIHRVEFCRAVFIPGHGTVPRLTIEEGKPLELEWGTLDTTPPSPALLVKQRDTKTGESHILARIPVTSVDVAHEVDVHESQAVVDGKPLSQHRIEAAEKAAAREKVEAREKAIRDAAAQKLADDKLAQKEAQRIRDEIVRARKAAEKEQAEKELADYTARQAAAAEERAKAGKSSLPGIRK